MRLGSVIFKRLLVARFAISRMLYLLFVGRVMRLLVGCHNLEDGDDEKLGRHVDDAVLWVKVEAEKVLRKDGVV